MVDETSVLLLPQSTTQERPQKRGWKNVRARGLGGISKQNSVL